MDDKQLLRSFRTYAGVKLLKVAPTEAQSAALVEAQRALSSVSARTLAGVLIEAKRNIGGELDLFELPLSLAPEAGFQARGDPPPFGCQEREFAPTVFGGVVRELPDPVVEASSAAVVVTDDAVAPPIPQDRLPDSVLAARQRHRR